MSNICLSVFNNNCAILGKHSVFDVVLIDDLVIARMDHTDLFQKESNYNDIVLFRMMVQKFKVTINDLKLKSMDGISTVIWNIDRLLTYWKSLDKKDIDMDFFKKFMIPEDHEDREERIFHITSVFIPILKPSTDYEVECANFFIEIVGGLTLPMIKSFERFITVLSGVFVPHFSDTHCLEVTIHTIRNIGMPNQSSDTVQSVVPVKDFSIRKGALENDKVLVGSRAAFGANFRNFRMIQSHMFLTIQTTREMRIVLSTSPTSIIYPVYHNGECIIECKRTGSDSTVL